MKNKALIWTFLDDETQELFFDLQGRLSETDKNKVENQVLSKIGQKGRPIVGVTAVKFEEEQFILAGTFGECSFPNTLLKPNVDS